MCYITKIGYNDAIYDKGAINMYNEYSHKDIETKWRKYWEENNTFKTDVWDFSKPKYYALDMFPYPSGVGLHRDIPRATRLRTLCPE